MDGIKIKSKFGYELDITKEDALLWARRKMTKMTMGDDKSRIVQVNKFLTGIQFTVEELNGSRKSK